MFRLIHLPALLLCLTATACTTLRTTGESELTQVAFTTFDELTFPVRTWNEQANPRVIVIATHGINGAAKDFENLGNRLTSSQSDVQLIAANVRGQGRDPRPARRGDILRRKAWFKDLRVLTGLVRQQHPRAKVVWMGESMGTLILLSTVANSEDSLCDGLILTSPIVGIDKTIDQARRDLLKLGATLTPGNRVSLQELAGDTEAKVTAGENHDEQSALNPWHIEKFTLRLLYQLGQMVEKAPAASQKITVPTLILYGGKDVFTPAENVATFVEQLPESASATSHFYPESYHLLFYDTQQKAVIDDTVDWLKSVR